MLSAAIVLRRRTATSSAAASARLIALLAGLLDSLANLAFLFAVHHARLAVIAVIVALYPAVTVLVARAMLGRCSANGSERCKHADCSLLLRR